MLRAWRFIHHMREEPARAADARCGRIGWAVGVLLSSLALGAIVATPAGSQGGQPPSADLSVSKSDSPDPVTSGTQLTYTVEVRNEGPDPATEVAITDDFPGPVDLLSATPSAGTCDPRGGRVTCTLPSLAPNAVGTLVVVVMVNKKKGSITNSASVQSAVADPQPGNNLDTEVTQVVEPTGGPTCKGRQATIIGTEVDETINGTNKKDVIVALGGHDIVFGFDGRDTVCGGTGDDTIRGQADADLLRGGSGNDVLRGALGSDDVGGGAGRDRLSGGLFSDILKGGPGRDSCNGGPGADVERSC
jgi:uncharacterized repeat protein (TIGR01451 family)